MKNIDRWHPTKYIWKGSTLRASRDTRMVSFSSRLMTDITATFYQRYLPLHAKGRLADLGCGNVPFYHVYKELVTENICVDWPGSLHKNEYLDLECDLNKPLPLEDNSFDTLVISEVLEHIANPELIWQEMTRILKPGGKLILSVPFMYKIHEAPHDYYRYTEFALKNFAQKNDLKLLELKAFGGLPEVLTDIYAKNLLKLPLIGRMASAFSQWLCWRFVKTVYGRKVSSRTASAYPLGYFMIVEK